MSGCRFPSNDSSSRYPRQHSEGRSSVQWKSTLDRQPTPNESRKRPRSESLGNQGDRGSFRESNRDRFEVIDSPNGESRNRRFSFTDPADRYGAVESGNKQSDNSKRARQESGRSSSWSRREDYEGVKVTKVSCDWHVSTDNDSASKPGLLGQYPGDVRSSLAPFPRDFQMSSLPEMSNLSDEQFAMLPHNLQIRSRNGEGTRHPWEDILSDRDHPSPLHGRPFAQMRSPLYGSPLRHHSEDKFRTAVTPTLFGSLTDQFRSQVKTSSFAKSKLSCIDRKEPSESISPPVEPVLASKTKSTYKIHDTEFAGEKYDVNDVVDLDDDEEVEDDDVFMKPHPVTGQQFHTSSSFPTCLQRLPNRDYLRRSLDGASKKLDESTFARSRSLDCDRLINGPKKAGGIEDDVSESGVHVSWQKAEDAFQLNQSQIVSSSSVPDPASQLDQKTPPPDDHLAGATLLSPSENIYSRPSIAMTPTEGSDELRDVSTGSSDPARTDDPRSTRLDGSSHDTPGNEETTTTVALAEVDQTEESNDSVISDFAGDFFRSWGKEDMKTFSLGDEYVIDDGQPPPPSITNFFDRSFENFTSLPSTSFLSAEGPKQMVGSAERASNSEVDDGKSLIDSVDDARKTRESFENRPPANWHTSWRETISAAHNDYQSNERSLTRLIGDADGSGNQTFDYNRSCEGEIRISDEDEKERLNQLRSFSRRPTHETLALHASSAHASELDPKDRDEMAHRIDSSSSNEDEKERLKQLRSFSRTRRLSSPRYSKSSRYSDYSDSESDDDSYDHEADYYSTEERPKEAYERGEYYDEDDIEVVDEYFEEDGSPDEYDDYTEGDEGNVTEILSDDSDVDGRSAYPSRIEAFRNTSKSQVYADAKELVDELILAVGSLQSEAEPEDVKGSELTDEELEDVVVLFLSEIINEVDPSLNLSLEQTVAFNKYHQQTGRGPLDQVLISDNALEVTVTRCSLKTLIEEVPVKRLTAKSHVNDEVINSYMSLIRHRSIKQPELPKIFAFNTFFFESLRNGGHDRVKRWTRGKDIFQYDMIIIPLNFKSEHHWALFIIDLSAKVFVHYDSLLNRDLAKFKQLKLTKQIRIVTMFREYLEKEVVHKKSDYDLNLKSFSVDFCSRFPQQRNLIDCGIFCMRFAEAYTRRGNIDFCQAEMLHYRQKICLELYDMKISIEP